MIKTGLTYDHVAAVARAFHIVSQADGIDDLEIIQMVIDAGHSEDVIRPINDVLRRALIEDELITPATMAVLDELLAICDAETALCFVTLKARGR